MTQSWPWFRAAASANLKWSPRPTVNFWIGLSIRCRNLRCIKTGPYLSTSRLAESMFWFASFMTSRPREIATSWKEDPCSQISTSRTSKWSSARNSKSNPQWANTSKESSISNLRTSSHRQFALLRWQIKDRFIAISFRRVWRQLRSNCKFKDLKMELVRVLTTLSCRVCLCTWMTTIKWRICP